MIQRVTSKDLHRKFGEIRTRALQSGVMITHHGRDDLALLPAAEYKRLKALDTRRALYPHELSDEIKAELEKGYQGPETPELDHLMQ